MIIMAIAAALCVNADDKAVNLKWGKPTTEEMEMTAYSADSLADAVVLARQDLVRFSVVGNYFKISRTVKRRVKVLTDDGKSAANGAISYYYNKRATNNCETLGKLKATAWNIEGGKVVKTSMSNATISHEDVTERVRVTKYAVPQVHKGTVFEVEYTIDSDLVSKIDDWVAQDMYPVAYTEYDVVVPECYAFNIDETGFCRLEHEQRSVTVRLGGTHQMAGTEYIFIGRDLPALKDEDHVFGSQAYAHRVAFELRQFALPGQLIRNFTTSWEDVDKLLMEHDNFGKRLGGSALKDEVTAAGIREIDDERERAQRCIDLVRSRVKWNGNYALTSPESDKHVLKDGSGSNAEINFLLINTLNDVGVQAVPAVLRDRASGFLPVSRPSIDALTTMIVAINLNGEWHYYDGSARYGGLDIIPAVLLSDRVRLVSKKGGSWVSLNELAQGRTTVHISATLATDGTINGVIEERYSGMAAQSVRSNYHAAADSAAFIDEQAADNDITITSVEMKGMDDERGGAVTTRMEFTKTCQTVSDGLMLLPSVISLIDDSPFKHGKRVLPVDLPYCQTILMSTALTLPDGYTVEEMLPQRAMSMQNSPKMRFERITELADGMLKTMYRLVEGENFITPDAYDQLTTFFDETAKACTDMVIIKPAKQ